MYKNFVIIFVFFLLNTIVCAQEPTLSKLRTVHSNGYQKFSIGMYEFVCRPYGVVTLEELYYKADNNSSCQKNIQNFFKKNPLEGYFSENLLKLRQLYHTEFRNTKCILYAKGKLSLSELILKNGLGLKEPNFDDKEFNHLFRNAQAYAKQNKIGLFEDGLIEPSCIEFLKTKE